IEPPDHPLVKETLDNCLYEAMDAQGLRTVLERIESGAIRTLAVETAAPSPMSHEILNANPYAFLDDAPLEERRARAVSLRRTDPDLAAGIGALDPEAIAEGRRQAWPDARDADEVHDALLTLGVLPAAEAVEWSAWLDQLIRDNRAFGVRRLDAALGWEGKGEGLPPPPSPPQSGSKLPHSIFAAAERSALVRAAYPAASIDPPLLPLAYSERENVGDGQAAVLEIVRGWMDSIGPTTAAALAGRLFLSESAVDGALLQLEADGCVLRGGCTPGHSAELE